MWKWMMVSVLFFSLINDEPTGIEKINLKLSEDEIAFTFFDLVDGESTLILDSEGNSILINTGGAKSEEELEHYLDTYNVKSIDLLIITSDQDEYIGNTSWLFTNIEIGSIILPSSLERTWNDTTLPVQFWKKEEKMELFNGVTVSVLTDSISDHIGMDLLLQFGRNDLLYMTSANKEIEQQLLKKYALKNVHVLKVGDFGSEQGTHGKFLKETDPQVAIIFKKGSATPDTGVLERLQDTWIDIYQTKQVGNVTVKLTKTNYQVFTIPIRSTNMLSKSR
ncbi:ComEC/Rec2 family competence protein [Sutcliffiella cohnii]